MCCTVIYYVGCYNILVITVSINVRVVSLKYIYFFVSFRLLSVVSYYLLVVSLGIGVLDSISVVLFVEVIYVVFLSCHTHYIYCRLSGWTLFSFMDYLYIKFNNWTIFGNFFNCVYVTVMSVNVLHCHNI